jgi:2-polyprenyl-6-hydroxyphenyl methylase / 3-demethylubiquinone-9 3-methyltransferase
VSKAYTKNNVDANEIENFSSLADKWWQLDGPMQPLHQINPLRLEFIQQHAKLNNTSCVDVGCGAGILSEALAKANATVTAIDASDEMINTAKKHAQLNNLKIDYQSCTAEELYKQNAKQFDIVCCMEVIEHVPDPSQLIAQCAKLLSPHGKLFISTINRTLPSFLLNIVAAEYISGIIPVGTHNYAQFLKPSEIDAAAEKAGLKSIAIEGIRYSLSQQKFMLHSGKPTNYMMCLQKP